MLRAARSAGSSSSSGKKREVRSTMQGRPAVRCSLLAQRLGGQLGGAVDVLRARRQGLVDPDGRLVGRRPHRVAEGAGRAGADERLHAGVDGGLQQAQRAADVGVDEVLAAVRGDVRLVQRGGVQHAAHAGHRRAHAVAVDDGADDVGPRRRHAVQADGVFTGRAQGAHQRFAEVAGTAGDEDAVGHGATVRRPCAGVRHAARSGASRVGHAVLSTVRGSVVHHSCSP